MFVLTGGIVIKHILLVININFTRLLQKMHNLPFFMITDFTFIHYNFKVVRARNKNIRIGENS